MNRDDVANINELKNYFEEYLRGGMKLGKEYTLEDLGL